MAVTRYTYPKKVSATVTDPSNAVPGDPIPPEVKVVGGYDGAAVRALSTDANGRLQVDVISAPTPTGGATAAKQDTGNASLASIDSKLTNPLPVSASALPLPTGAATEATLASLNGKVTAVNTGAVVVASSALPTGAATEATLATLATAANQSAQSTLIGAVTETAPASDTASSGLNGRLQRIAQRITSLIALLPASLGQKTGANSLAVVLASDQAGLAVPGKTRANAPLRNDYTSVSVTTGAYVQLVASTSLAATEIEIFDSSGQTLVLAVGGSGSEIDQLNIFPGGNGRVPLAIPAASRISVKAVSATASVGELDINLYA